MILNNANNILKNFQENANIRIKSKIDILIDNYLFLSRIKMEDVNEEDKEDMIKIKKINSFKKFLSSSPLKFSKIIMY